MLFFDADECSQVVVLGASVECLLTFPALRVYWREALTAVLLSNLLDLSSIAASLGKPAF